MPTARLTWNASKSKVHKLQKPIKGAAFGRYSFASSLRVTVDSSVFVLVPMYPLLFLCVNVNCFLLMASQARKSGKRMLAFSPASATKDPQKGRTVVGGTGEDGSQDEGMQESDICDSINTADIHEIVVTRVIETLTAYKNAQGELDSPVIKQLVPALATAVAVAVSEAMKGMMRTMASHGHGTSAMSTATENRLLATVTSLTYENDRLQQYSRRESVRNFDIRQAEGETAEQVEQKALSVFKEAGADVKDVDIAAVYLVGKIGRGPRPVLVKFVSRRKRSEVMEKKKSLKGRDGYQNVYINDDRTSLRAKLLALVKRLDDVDKAWTVGGSIHCTKKVPREPEVCRRHRHS